MALVDCSYIVNEPKKQQREREECISPVNQQPEKAFRFLPFKDTHSIDSPNPETTGIYGPDQSVCYPIYPQKQRAGL